MRTRDVRGRRGSVLIVVLWVLLTISLLAGRYMVHNRGKTAAAIFGWEELVREQALLSVLELYATTGQPLPESPAATAPETAAGDGARAAEPAAEENAAAGIADAAVGWRALTVGEVDILVRVSEEDERLNLSSAAEDAMRETIRNGLGDYRLEEADRLTDALLDWRDADDEVRTDGAEAGYYVDAKLPWVPADGPFKTITEALLVRGVTRELFWGVDPPGYYGGDEFAAEAETEAGDRRREADVEVEEAGLPGSAAPGGFCIFEAFTVSPRHARRVDVCFPGEERDTPVYSVVLWPQGRGWKQLWCYRRFYRLPAAEEESEER
ncbi:MAG: general secretion pathway protein GspK [Deltaproteobacteria bacterium]|nr:general secretion pathway protein GspK [Candidatus Anaeroferrophillacea bacterium]